MSGDSFCAPPPLHLHSICYVSFANSVSSGVNLEVPAEVSRLRLHLLWTFAPLVSSKVSLQNFACRGTTKKKSTGKRPKHILSISCIEFFLLQKANFATCGSFTSKLLFTGLLFFLLLFFLHNFHVIVAKLNMCIESCERKSNFHLLPQTFRKENISSQIFLFTD